MISDYHLRDIAFPLTYDIVDTESINSQQSQDQDMTNLSKLTAKQIMSRELLTVSDNWSIQTLIEFFNKHKVTGAPVLSSKKHFIGVVSLSDILNFDNNAQHKLSENPLTQFYYNTLEGVSVDDLGISSSNQHLDHVVSEIMTPEIITADIDNSITKIAGIMYNQGIHRIFITEDEQIKGVISTLDILKLVADS